MNCKRILLKDAIQKLCTLRCENLRMIYECQDNTSKEKEIKEQEKYINELIDASIQD